MTETAITAVPPLPAAVTAAPGEDAERSAFFAALRAYAGMEGCPQVPLPAEGRLYPVTFHFLHDGDPCAAMAAAARALGGPWRASTRDYGPAGGAYFDLLGEPQGLKVCLTAYRDEACEQDGGQWRARPALAAVLAAGTGAA